jgi:site-specific recombinase XerD
VQKALNHASVTTTSRYAHVTDDEIADAMERAAELRNKPRKTLREVS